jgi:ankyrin repeat protein
MSPPDSATPITQTHSIEDEIESSSSEAIEALEKSMATNNTDPVHSSRFSLSQSSSTNSLSGEHNFVPIEPDLYKFLVNGTKDEILGLSTNLEDFKSLEERNSVLHIAASAGQSDLISDILPQCKELIKWKNIKGDLPLHSAAKSGQFNALKALITWDGFSKEILGWANKKGDTVLHIALQNNQQEMGEFLVGEYCIGKACYMMNNEEVCPLYLGIKLGYWDLVRNIISYTSQNKEDSEKALLQGMSVVHAAIEVNNIGKVFYFHTFSILKYSK